MDEDFEYADQFVPDFDEVSFVQSFGGDHGHMQRWLDLGALLDRHHVQQWHSLTQTEQICTLVRIGDREAIEPQQIEEAGSLDGSSEGDTDADGIEPQQIEGAGSLDGAITAYSLALHIATDPGSMMELGCLFLRRHGAELQLGDELPQCCANPRAEEPYVEKALHSELGRTSLVLKEPALAELALEAFTNAWSFYRRYGNTIASDVSEDDDTALSAARCWLSLDGIRISLEALGRADSIWTLVNNHGIIYEDERTWWGRKDIYLGFILTGVRTALAQTMGRWQGPVRGRKEARERLWKEFKWFDSIPLAVADRPIDGEYESQMLVDPTHGRTAPIMSYALAAECMVQLLITRPIDGYLDKLPKQENDDFKQRFRKHNNKPWRRDLGMGVVVHNLTGNPSFQEALSHVGADIPYVLGELPGELSKLSDLRNDAAHGRGVFTEEQRALARAMATKIVGELARLSPMAAIQRGDRSDDG